tara:strand:+ start:261 stop:695 length:435 start_codon:yes stop_codon:yes gene_type:complete
MVAILFSLLEYQVVPQQVAILEHLAVMEVVIQEELMEHYFIHHLGMYIPQPEVEIPLVLVFLELLSSLVDSVIIHLNGRVVGVLGVVVVLLDMQDQEEMEHLLVQHHHLMIRMMQQTAQAAVVLVVVMAVLMMLKIDKRMVEVV